LHEAALNASLAHPNIVASECIASQVLGFTYAALVVITSSRLLQTLSVHLSRHLTQCQQALLLPALQLHFVACGPSHLQPTPTPSKHSVRVLR
jgi:hypothetical protein